MTAPVRRVVVVGAGIAGLSCALACARTGAVVDVLEARAEPQRTPAHLDVVPHLLRDFARLGIADACVRSGFAYNGLAVVDERGQVAFEVPTPRLAGAQLPCAVGMEYDAALDLLRSHARAAGAAFHADCTVEAIQAQAGGVFTADARRFAADLVVLATGMQSALAQRLFGESARSTASQSWWHALLPRPQGLDRSTWMAGSPGRRLLMVPISMARAGIAVVRTEAAEAGTDAAALRKTLFGWGPLPRSLAALIRLDTPITLRPARIALRSAPWYRGSVVCVGACASALPPTFGQAAAQALEDAVVLGELVAQRLDCATLLDSYMRRRGERASRVHSLLERASRWVAQPEPATDLPSLSQELGSILAAPA